MAIKWKVEFVSTTGRKISQVVITDDFSTSKDAEIEVIRLNKAPDTQVSRFLDVQQARAK